MRTYSDAATRAIRALLAAISLQAVEGRIRLADRYRDAVWRLNEAEAQVHAGFFADRWQSLSPCYGERRALGSGDADYWPRYSSNAPYSLHTGDPKRRSTHYDTPQL